MYDKKLRVYFVVFTILYIFATDKISILVKITIYLFTIKNKHYEKIMSLRPGSGLVVCL